MKDASMAPCGAGIVLTCVCYGGGGVWWWQDNLLIKNDVRCETDQVSHLYTLHIK
jgi:hypothetical protein